MTLSINGNEIGQAIEIAITVASIVMLVVGAFVVWLMVRPSRHGRKPRKSAPVREADADELDQMVRMIERMEERLAVLERAIGDGDEAPRRLGAEREDRFLQMGEESPETRRTK